MKHTFSEILKMLFVLLIFTGCKQEEKKNVPTDVLIQVGDSVLTKSKVLSQIPLDLAPADSAKLFDMIVQNWVDRCLLSEIALENIPHKGKIEKIVSDYRMQLITNEYRRLMADENVADIPVDTVEQYYFNHINEFLVDNTPLLKGIYLKVPDNAERIEDLSEWMKSGTTEDIDKIEKYGLKEAMQYEYFNEKWVSWQTIANQIPYRFSDPTTFVANNKDFQTTYNRSTYMLHITDYLVKGDTMPIEYASPQIRNRLMGERRKDYDTQLMRSLYEKAKQDKKIYDKGYVPNRYK